MFLLLAMNTSSKRIILTLGGLCAAVTAPAGEVTRWNKIAYGTTTSLQMDPLTGEQPSLQVGSIGNVTIIGGMSLAVQP